MAWPTNETIMTNKFGFELIMFYAVLIAYPFLLEGHMICNHSGKTYEMWKQAMIKGSRQLNTNCRLNLYSYPFSSNKIQNVFPFILENKRCKADHLKTTEITSMKAKENKMIDKMTK